MDDEKKTTGAAAGSEPGFGQASGRGLGAIWQSALGQIDEIRDVIVRGSHAGKAKIDAQLLRRQRERLLVQLGEAVLEETKRGGAVPAGCDALVARVDDIDAEIAAMERSADDPAGGRAGGAASGPPR